MPWPRHMGKDGQKRLVLAVIAPVGTPGGDAIFDQGKVRPSLEQIDGCGVAAVEGDAGPVQVGRVSFPASRPRYLSMPGCVHAPSVPAELAL